MSVFVFAIPPISQRYHSFVHFVAYPSLIITAFRKSYSSYGNCIQKDSVYQQQVCITCHYAAWCRTKWKKTQTLLCAFCLTKCQHALVTSALDGCICQARPPSCKCRNGHSRRTSPTSGAVFRSGVWSELVWSWMVSFPSVCIAMTHLAAPVGCYESTSSYTFLSAYIHSN